MLHNPFEYCQNQIAPAGSLYYAALRRQPFARFQTAIVLHTLINTLENILLTVHDPGVARLKLQWWREHLIHAVTGKSVNTPLAQTISTLTFVTENHIHAWCDAIKQRLDVPQFQTFATQFNYFKQLTGKVFALIATQHHTAEPTVAAAETLGAVSHFYRTQANLQVWSQSHYEGLHTTDKLAQQEHIALLQALNKNALRTLKPFYFLPLIALQQTNAQQPLWPLKKLWISYFPKLTI